jgi:predicted O-methyltransferase YrrM
VAFIHIDMNHPTPEEAAMRHFWPRLTPGGVMVLDDYAYVGFERSHQSADRVASELGFPILSLPTGQGLAIKPLSMLAG